METSGGDNLCVNILSVHKLYNIVRKVLKTGYMSLCGGNRVCRSVCKSKIKSKQCDCNVYKVL